MSETALLIVESARRLLDREAPAPSLDAPPPGLVRAIEESGLLTLLVSDEDGMWLAAAELMQVWGERGAPYPLVERMLGARIADRSGIEKRAILARGVASITRHADGWRLTGSVAVPVLYDTECILVLATGGGSPTHLVVVDASDANLVAAPDIAGMLQLHFPAEGLHLEDSAISRSPHDGQRVLAEGAVLTAAAMVGAMQRIRDLALGYAGMRVQFGRPIGKFQAVQTLISELAAEVVAARAAVGRAVASLEENRADEITWLIAKARSAQAAGSVAAASHQVFGAIGFTAEHELGCHTRRLWAWRDAWMRQSEAETQIGRLAARRGSVGLWQMLVGGFPERT